MPSLATGRTVAAECVAGPPRDCHDNEQGQNDDQGHPDVDMQQDQEGQHSKHTLAQNVTGPIQGVLGCIGLAGGEGQGISTRPVQNTPKQVATQ